MNPTRETFRAGFEVPGPLPRPGIGIIVGGTGRKVKDWTPVGVTGSGSRCACPSRGIDGPDWPAVDPLAASRARAGVEQTSSNRQPPTD